MLKTVDPSVIVVLGGPEVSYDTNIWLRQIKEIDYVVVGEGEQSFKDLLNFLSKKQTIKEVPGLAYVQDDKFILNPLPPKLDLRLSPPPTVLKRISLIYRNVSSMLKRVEAAHFLVSFAYLL